MNEKDDAADGEPDEKEPDPNDLKSQFSCTLVWYPIPTLSAYLPCIGHYKAITTDAVCHDFCGSKYVKVQENYKETPKKYIPLKMTSYQKVLWDKVLKRLDKKFERREFSVCGWNSYSYSKELLNKIKYEKKSNYTGCSVCCLSCCKAKYTSCCAVFTTWIWLFLYLIIVILILVLLNI